jgi:hypothetical protein
VNAIFHASINSGDKSCKIIVYSRSCIKALSSKIVARLGLKFVPHLQSYSVYGFKPRKPRGLLSMSSYAKMFNPVEYFARKVHDLHVEITQ